MGLPPGSRLPGVAQTALLVRDPFGYFVRSRRKFGPVFRSRFVGIPRIVYVATPALAEQVLRTDRDIGEAGTARKDFLEPLVGAHSVLCLEGDAWLRERRRLAAPFHGQRVRRWGDTIADVVAAQVARWPQGTPFALRPWMQQVTLEVMFRVVFGLNSGDGRSSSPADGEAAASERALRAQLPGLVDVASNAALAFVPARIVEWLDQAPLARRLAHNPIARFGQLKQSTDALLLDQIRRRRQAGPDDSADVLSTLVAEPGMTDEQIRDELITLLEAGHETTATGIAWMFDQLLRSPAALAKALDAVVSGDPSYLQAIVKETLRIRPVVVDAPRVLTASLDLHGYRVPAGWYVAPVIPLVHTDPEAFPDPDSFRPERFLGDPLPSGAWIPFGGSRRMCLGIQLAMFEMRVVLAEVLRHVELWPVDHAAERPRMRGVTLVPEHHTRVVARRRLLSR
ncbi:MAG: cytochrome P450 [Nocardioidaceae bacterium]